MKGVRALTCGLLIGDVALGGSTHLLGWFVLTATCIPVGDAVIVQRSSGPSRAVYGVHGATALVMLAVSLVLLLA